jgi:hypothetical protein
MQVEWRIPESAPFFIVSNTGSVIVADTNKSARIADNGHGYKQVQIMRLGKRYTRYVHRLVAECFIEKADGMDEVNHIDGNKSNNCVSNLEWCNHSKNLKHAFATGLRHNTTEKQREAARRNAEKSRGALKEGWKKWAATASARECWIRNLENADRWGKKKRAAL